MLARALNVTVAGEWACSQRDRRAEPYPASLVGGGGPSKYLGSISDPEAQPIQTRSPSEPGQSLAPEGDESIDNRRMLHLNT